ncbi:MAG: hypothetical protein GF317_17510 [Candidatus Lokiarchaeota archaeon]|nr:hypothetical protein [Candidatus Lokiarchaeota archaeon]MBD3201319.1 hypothetical protein [Candidatus Lokiarchaeota archaeon]
MKECYYCHSRIETMSYRCKYCGMVFCNLHRLPENHNCEFNFNFQQTENLLYQDALDFMEKDMEVSDIYHYFTTKEYSEKQVFQLLTFFLENSDDIEVRVNCIHALKLLDLDKDTTFLILESTIISDTSQKVKEIAISLAQDLYPNKSKNLIDWLEDE